MKACAWLLVATFAATVSCYGLQGNAAEVRTWKDSTGNYKVDAEFVSADSQNVTLKRVDGMVITVPLARLSDADRQAVVELSKPPEPARTLEPASSTTEDQAEVQAVAEKFFEDLRSETRLVVRTVVSDQARKLIDDGQSVLETVPIPDDQKNSVRIGKPKVSQDQSTVPVTIRVKGDVLRTILQLRKRDNRWLAVALGLKRGKDTVDLDFEQPKPKDVQPSNDSRTFTLDTVLGEPISVTGVTLQGRPASLSQYRGKVVLIDFWATWCGPCRAEIPNIAANYEKYRAKGFEVISISVDKDLDALVQFAATERTPWAIWADHHPLNPQSMAARFGTKAIPALMLIDQEGKVVSVNCRGDRLGQELSKLLDPQ